MKYLLYCIVSCSERQQPEALAGVDGQPVSLIMKNGVGAAVSKIELAADHVPDISQILAYKKVIETLHDNHTVIPMRYGCLFENERQIIRLLEERGHEHQALLLKLEGCVEMGIRVLISQSTKRLIINPECGTTNTDPITPNPKPTSSGREYLTALKTRYAQDELLNEEVNIIKKQCCAVFSGLFVQYKEEYPQVLVPRSSSIHNPPTAFSNMCSLYFLVPKKSVNLFQQVFRKTQFEKSIKLLLSGPWPPYNFVLP